jgi:hypothetical protein
VESGKVSGEDIRYVVDDIATTDLGLNADEHSKVIRHFDQIIQDTYAAVASPPLTGEVPDGDGRI